MDNNEDLETIKACLFETQRLLDISQECIRELRADLAAAQEELRKAREQEPVAESDSAGKLYWLHSDNSRQPMKLYAAPVPAILSAAPEAVAKDANEPLRAAIYAWFPLRLSKKRQLISDYGIAIPQGPTESDSQWAMRALHAMLERPECRAAILSATDTEGRKDE